MTVFSSEGSLLKGLDWLKKCLVVAITCMVAMVLILCVVELGYILVKDISREPYFILNISELLELFGLFLLVLIGIELLETMEIYIRKNVIHVEVVFTVALIAVARKVIILDIKKIPGPALFGLGFIILSLAAGYYVIHRVLPMRRDGSRPGPGKTGAIASEDPLPKE
jgi:uncharacterized membrane protein (DUF373 family)